MILYNSENSIRDIRPFCRLLYCHSSAVKFSSSLLQSETVMRLDYQIILKSPPPPNITGWIRPWVNTALNGLVAGIGVIGPAKIFKINFDTFVAS